MHINFWPLCLTCLLFGSRDAFGGSSRLIMQRLAKATAAASKIGPRLRPFSTQIISDGLETPLKQRNQVDENPVKKSFESSSSMQAENQISNFQEAFRKFTNILGNNTSSSTDSSNEADLKFIDKDGIISKFMRSYGNQIEIVENEGIYKLVLNQHGDWSSKEAETELLNFIGKIIGELDEIQGESSIKYRPKFFDKIMAMVLHLEPGKVPSMLLLTDPTPWPNTLMFSQDGDEGSPMSVGLPEFGTTFKCTFERFNMMPNHLGLGAYAQYIFQKEDTKGDFEFRLYYENQDPKEGVKFIGFELIPHRADE